MTKKKKSEEVTAITLGCALRDIITTVWGYAPTEALCDKFAAEIVEEAHTNGETLKLR